MSDIFISYAHEDRPRAQMLAETLGGHGWSIFWDRTIPTGKTWRETIGRALNDARCVVVLWSKTSIESGWMQEEADDAKRRGVLVPILIENVQPPVGFRSIQVAHLVDWDGTESTQAFRRLIADIAALIGLPPKKAKEEDRRSEAEVERKTKADAKRRADEEEGNATEAERKEKEKEKEKEKREPPFARPKQERLQETGAETPTPGEAPVVPELRRRKVALAIGIPLLVAVALAAAAVIISGKPSDTTATSTSSERTLQEQAKASNTTATSTSSERTLQEQAKARWSDVQNQYQGRADLIPNLVATVQGYAAQDKSVLTAVIEARAKATKVKVDVSDLTDPARLKAFEGAQNQLSGALDRLLAVTENYPDLKSNANFLALRSKLEGTENRIIVARRDYNDAVRAYNTALRTTSAVSSEKPMTEFTGGG